MEGPELQTLNLIEKELQSIHTIFQTLTDDFPFLLSHLAQTHADSFCPSGLLMRIISDQGPLNSLLR